MADFPAEKAPSPVSLVYPSEAGTSSHNAELAFNPFGTPAVVTSYLLGAYDNSGRRYWVSPTFDFASAPVPVGAWNVATLTIMAILT
jgi:hypothetical protein